MFVIAGVTGHVGSVAAKELLAKKQVIKVIVRDAAKGAAWSKLGAEVAVGALDDVAFLTSTLKHAKAFFTLLPPPPPSEPDFYGAQRKLASTIAAAVKAAGVPHVVMLSSVGADLASGNGPIRGLHFLEEDLRASGTKLSAIRAGYFQENVGGPIQAAKNAGIFPNFFPSADAPVPMIATKDIGHLVAETITRNPAQHEIIDLVGPAYSSNQLAEKIGAALGKTLKVVDVPAAGHVAALVQAGLPKHMAEIYADMYAGFASGKIQPKAERLEKGHTPIDDTLKTLVG